MNQKVEESFRDLTSWKEEQNLLRSIVLSCGLQEEYKWKQACYTFNAKNIVIIGGFKEYCALLLFKGSLLSDSENILVSPGENSQSGRQIRFKSCKEILELETIIRRYIFEAIEVEKAGVKVKVKTLDEYEVPQELMQKFEKEPQFETAFKSLTPGRQKAYLLHFNQASQAKTREARIEKYEKRILNGKGILDCVCGLSKRMPSCDGSHKFLKD